MKILVIAFRNPFNYGAELQIFSLAKKLRMLGYDAEVLDLARPGVDPDARPSKRFETTYTKTFVQSLRRLAIHVRGQLLELLHYQRARVKVRNSRAFHARYNNFTKHRFLCFDELYAADLGYTHYIVGSDQVWNYENSFPLDPYFLTFVKKGKKIAYAASIGHSRLPEDRKQYYIDRLRSFDMISMRERQGSAIVSELLGRPIPTLLDPTILITPEQWREIFGIEDKPNGALVMYVLSYRPYLLQLAKEMARRHGIKKIIYISAGVSHVFHDAAVDYRFDVSAPEFVRLIANASFVVTNSFHGTAFATNFGRRFYSVVADRMQTSSRFYSLLGQVGLSDRIVKEGTDFDALVDNPIPVDAARERLDALRKESLSFLRAALS